MDVTYAQVEAVVTRLQRNDRLAGAFYVVGGLVPWLLADVDSHRLHSDLDIVVPTSVLDMFRQEMQRLGLYDIRLDARVQWPSAAIDFGFDVVIDGVIVNVAPYERVSHGIIQRNATYAVCGGVDACVTIEIPGLTEDEYVMHSVWHGTTLGHFPLALVYATKQVSQRPKDQADCAQIVRIGVNQHDITRYERALKGMSIIVTS